jgi:endonuclease/exonuclease/phosphatase (EEP) superfamily protein YafD
MFLLRGVLRGAALLYLFGLLFLLAALHWYGERSVALSILLYTPATLLLLPMVALVPICFLFGLRWMSLAQIAAAAGALFLYMTYGHGPASPVKPGDLTVVTNNIGEGNRPELLAFLNSAHPDVVLLQDALNRGPEFARAHPEWHVVSQNQFICLSRLPIVDSHLLPTTNWSGPPVAARFEILFHGQKMGFYSVHLPTPRKELVHFASFRLRSAYLEYHAHLQQRISLGREVAAAIAADPAPTVVCGDLNFPDHGFTYHRFASFLTDSFAKVGHGWGFTFPGYSHNLFTRGPWLRLDYVFAGRGWEPVTCDPEPGHLSQHRAVVARLALVTK